MKILFLFSLLFIGQAFYAQNAAQLVKAIRLKLEKVNDYSVDIHIKAQVPMIKIDEVDAKMYFKKPNRIKVESKGIAILPKQ